MAAQERRQTVDVFINHKGMIRAPTNGEVLLVLGAGLLDVHIHLAHGSLTPAKLEEMSALMRPMYNEVRKESVTWPAWESPHWEGKRIKEFIEGLKK